jgi:NTE family protein
LKILQLNKNKTKNIFCIIFFVIASNLFSQESQNIKPAISLTSQEINQKIWYEIINLPKNKRPKIALVLGGGGARGFAHIGVLQVFNEQQIPIDMIVGTSMGSIIGALYSSGLKTDEIEKIITQDGLKDFFRITVGSLFRLFFRDTFANKNIVENIIFKPLKNKNFNDLPIQFACVATDIVTGEKVVLRDGDVATAVRASSAIPGIFEPVEYKQRYLVDGGIVDNIPVDVAKGLGADIIIAVNIESDYTKHELKKAINMIFQISYIQGKRLNTQMLKDTDFILNPAVNDIDITNMESKDENIIQGRLETRKNIELIKDMIIKKVFNKNKI